MSFDPQAAPLKVPGEDLFINGFQQTRPQGPVNLDGGINDDTGDFVRVHGEGFHAEEFWESGKKEVLRGGAGSAEDAEVGERKRDRHL